MTSRLQKLHAVSKVTCKGASFFQRCCKNLNINEKFTPRHKIQKPSVATFQRQPALNWWEGPFNSIVQTHMFELYGDSAIISTTCADSTCNQEYIKSAC